MKGNVNLSKYKYIPLHSVDPEPICTSALTYSNCSLERGLLSKVVSSQAYTFWFIANKFPPVAIHFTSRLNWLLKGTTDCFLITFSYRLKLYLLWSHRTHVIPLPWDILFSFLWLSLRDLWVSQFALLRLLLKCVNGKWTFYFSVVPSWQGEQQDCPFNECLLSACHVPGTVPCTEDRAGNRWTKISALILSLHLGGGSQTVNAINK